MEARWLLKNVKAAYKTSDKQFRSQIQNVVLELSNDRGGWTKRRCALGTHVTRAYFVESSKLIVIKTCSHTH